MKFRLIVSLLFVFIATSAFSQITKLPKATLNTIDEKKIEIQEFAAEGHPKLISLWATWCGPCRKELAALDKVYPDWKEKYNLEIVAASVDIPPMLNNAKKMFEKNEWEFTFLHDFQQQLMGNLKLKGIPYSILVDGTGKIMSVQQGYYAGYEKELEKKIAAIAVN